MRSGMAANFVKGHINPKNGCAKLQNHSLAKHEEKLQHMRLEFDAFC